ncbi:ribonuclease Z [Christiangramia sp. ASW11-125]|uniref:ribonuclease Z n=1 Tax=Christiangramia sp. ASW11-125 TaxID=3400701 RepID=UPI003AAFBDC8
MKRTEKDNYILIAAEDAELKDFTSELTKHHHDFESSNIVVDLSNYKNLENQQLLAFLEVSNLHREANKSFVIVNDALGIDELPEELVVVPTLQEAEDMIQMDEIQRDLGF